MKNGYYHPLCPVCKTPVTVGGLIGRAGRAIPYCMKHWQERVKSKKGRVK